MVFNLEKFKKKIIKQSDDDNGLDQLIDITTDDVTFISSGLDAIDWVLGGGFPTRKLTEIAGPNQSGKSYIGLQALANTQKLGGLATFIEGEFALEKSLVNKVALNYKEAFHYRPDSLEEVYIKIRDLCKFISNLDENERPPFTTILVDSIAAFSGTNKSADEKISMRNILDNAQINSYYLRRVLKWIDKANAALIFINQLRKDPNTIWGDKDKTTGGETIPFQARIRCRFILGSKVKSTDKKNILGHAGTFFCNKNSLAPPFKKIDLSLDYKKGFDKYAGMLDIFLEQDLISKTGKTYEICGEKLVGKNNAEKYLKKNLEVYEDLKNKLNYNYND